MQYRLKRSIAYVGVLAMMSPAVMANVAGATEDPTGGLKMSEPWATVEAAPAGEWVRNDWNKNNGLVSFVGPTAAQKASSRIGAVGVEAEFERDPARARGSAFLVTSTSGGKRTAGTHGRNLATAETFVAGAPILGKTALDIMFIGDPSCARDQGAETVADVLNYVGSCKYGKLTFKFDRPVSDPILDFSGFGGNNTGAISYGSPPAGETTSYRNAMIRTSSSSNTMELTTPNTQLELIQDNGVAPTNAVLEGNRITVAQSDMPISGQCNPAPLEYEGKEAYRNYPNTNMRLATRYQAGCGSLLVRGENLTEVSFDVYLNVTNVGSWRPDNDAGASFKRADLSGLIGDPQPDNASPDGKNGAFYHGSLGPVAFMKGRPLPVSDYGDLSRVSLRLPEYSVGDYVWFDKNEDGIQDQGEQPAQGVLIELLDEDGAPVLNPETQQPITATTDQAGHFLIPGLVHGKKYRLRYTPPEGYVLTVANAGEADATNNSKPDPLTRTTEPFEFVREAYLANPAGSEKVNLNLDAGLIEPEPKLDLEKWIGSHRADTPENAVVVNSGQKIDVTFQVRNTGNVPLGNVNVTDSVISAEKIVPPVKKFNADGGEAGDWDGTLNPGEHAFFTAYLEGLESGVSHVNTATLEATPPSREGIGAQPITVQDKGHAETAKLELTKYINDDDAQDAPGVVVEDDQMTIKYTVRNPSKVQVNGVRVTDTVLAGTNAELQADINDKLAKVAPFDLAPGASQDVTITVKAPERGTPNDHKNEAYAEGMPYQPATNDAAPDDSGNNPPLLPGHVFAAPTIDKIRSNTDPAHATKPAVSLGEYIWFDDNKDGLQTDGEKPVPGVTVALLDATGQPVMKDGQPVTTTTDDKGKYLFENLKPGTYSVSVVPPEGYAFTQQNAGADVNVNSKVDPATGKTPAVEIAAGSNTTFDAGIYRLPSKIEVIKRVNNAISAEDNKVAAAAGSTMYFTFEVKNTGESPLKEVRLTDNVIEANSIVAPDGVYDAKGTRVADWTGRLEPGQYAFFKGTKVAPAAGEVHENTATVEGTQPPIPGSTDEPEKVTDTSEAKVYVPNIELVKKINDQDANDAPGVRILGNDMKISYTVRNTGQIAVKIDSIIDSVKTPANSPLQQAIADELAKGQPFTLEPGAEKTVEITVPAPGLGEANDHKNVAKATGVAAPPKVEEAKPGEPRQDEDDLPPAVVESNEDPAHAYKRPVSIGDYVWVDADKDGVQDEGELPLPGVTVELLDKDGQPVHGEDGQPLTAKTNDAGKYLFENLNPGEYKVRFQPPFGYVFTEPGRGGDVEKDSDANPTTGETAVEEVLTDSNLNFDAGLYKLVPGITVIKKINGFDANTPEAAAQVAAGGEMTVSFLVKNTGETVLNDVKVEDDTIDAQKIQAPATKHAADGADAGAYDGTLNPGEYAVYTAKAPAPAVAGGTHKNTATAKGVPPFDPNDASIDPKNPPTVEDQDDANAVAPKLTLKKFIKDAATEGKGDDAQTPEESVLVAGDNITIEYEVTNESTVNVENIVISDRVTVPADSKLAAEIARELAKVEAFELPPLGSKTVSITISAPDLGAEHADIAKATGVAVPGAPTEADQPKPGEPNPVTTPIQVESAEDPAHAHKPFAALGDKVWSDANKNGVQDPDEKPVVGVKVHLLNGAGAPVLKDGNPVIATTNDQGEYLFDELVPGDYKVCFELPAGYDFTGKNTVADAAADSDVDPATGTSDVVTLKAGDRVMTVHAGMVQRPAALELLKKINGFDAETVETLVPVESGKPMQVTFIVTNTGGRVMNNVTLTDDVIAATDIQVPAVRYHKDGRELGKFDGTLNPDEYVVYTATALAPEAGKLHESTATVVGEPASDDNQPQPKVEASNKGKAAAPELALKKLINGKDADETPGVWVKEATMDITYRVTNVGKMTVADITLADKVISHAGADIQGDIDAKLAEIAPFTLAAGQTQEFTITVPAPNPGYFAVHKDVAQATGTAQFPGEPMPNKPGEPAAPEPKLPSVVSNEDPAHAFSGPDMVPGIDVEKYINNQDADTEKDAVAVAPGSTMSISFKVTNTGNTVLKNVTLSDDVIAAGNITAREGFTGELKPGEVAWFDAKLPAPAAKKLHKNIATAKGSPFTPLGEPVADPNNPNSGQEWVLTDTDPAHAISSEVAAPPVTRVLAQTGAMLGSLPIVGLVLLVAGSSAMVSARRRG